MVEGSNVLELTVSELSGALKRTLEDSFGYVRVRGEISGLKKAASGHMYLALKDDNAVLDAVCWRGTQKNFRFAPIDGLEVIATGRITTYPGRSKYQLVVESLAPAGIGALMALLDERKKQFAAEGLFDPERKRPLPYLPEVIGIVTSPTGAVIRDILHRLAERCPREVLLWPALVQGEGAAGQIAAAIEGFSALPASGAIPRPDVLIVARGGGSIEDLWAFNEEAVVRAAAACTIPLISAVGHETDTTLIDYVADKRAPTPTAAAEIAVPVLSDLRRDLGRLGERQAEATARLIEQRRERLRGLTRGLPDLSTLLLHAQQRLDERIERLPDAYRRALDVKVHALERAFLRLRTPSERLARAEERLCCARDDLGSAMAQRLDQLSERRTTLGQRLTPSLVEQRVTLGTDGLAKLRPRLDDAAERRLARLTERLEGAARLLHSYDYRHTLRRGFALVRDEGDDLIASADTARRAQALMIEFQDGVIATLPAVPARATKPKAKRKERTEDLAEQGSLL